MASKIADPSTMVERMLSTSSSSGDPPRAEACGQALARPATGTADQADQTLIPASAHVAVTREEVQDDSEPVLLDTTPRCPRRSFGSRAPVLGESLWVRIAGPDGCVRWTSSSWLEASRGCAWGRDRPRSQLQAEILGNGGSPGCSSRGAAPPPLCSGVPPSLASKQKLLDELARATPAVAGEVHWSS